MWSIRLGDVLERSGQEEGRSPAPGAFGILSQRNGITQVQRIARSRRLLSELINMAPSDINLLDGVVCLLVANESVQVMPDAVNVPSDVRDGVISGRQCRDCCCEEDRGRSWDSCLTNAD